MIRYIFNMTSGFRWRIFVTAVTGAARVVTGLVFVALSKRIVDIATGVADGDLGTFIAALIITLIIELTCSTVCNRTTELSEAAMKNKLQERYFSRLLNATWSGRESLHSGDMLSRLTDDCRIASETLCRTIPTILTSLFQLAGAFLFLWYFSPMLAIILLLILPMFIFAGKIFYRRMRVLSHRIRVAESRLQVRMQESLQHRLLLITYRITTQTLDSIASLQKSRLNLIRRRTNITVYSRTAIVTGFETGYLAAFLWGIFGLKNGTVSFGLMTAYLQLAGQIQRPSAELARLLPGLVQAHTTFSRLSSLDSIPLEDIPEDTKALSEISSPPGISFNKVTFSYPGSDNVVFKEFSYSFEPGSRTAVMGITGIGKSTLLRLIMGLLKPQEGKIELFTVSNGVRNAVDVSVNTRSEIVYVPQGNSLLSGTIRQNLQMGKPDASEEEMITALHTAAADFVMNLKSGLDTSCGEHGEGFSEGQAQRIAIARGLLRPGSILLLDEISASIDEDTERQLMQRLTESRTNHTIILVTHRKGILPYFNQTLHL